MELTDRTIQEMDRGEIPLGIFLDLSKAFDTLNHNILLDKLNFYGIKNGSLQLLKSYLSNRSQYVEYNKIQSKSIPITTGVPQGSILGPLLFIIYLNDISLSTKLFKIIVYADDTTLMANLSDFNEGNRDQIINDELSKINNWLKLNKLSLNATKSKFMIFKKPQKRATIPIIKINDTTLECVDNFNFLCLIINTNLSWKTHLNKVSNKIARIIGIMNKLKSTLPQNTLLHIYNSLIMPHINYCLILWGNVNKRIFQLQKKAVRIIHHENRFSHTDPIFKKLKLLKISDIFRLQLLKFHYKNENNLLPVYFDSFNFKLNSEIHDHNTRNRHKLHTSLVKHDFAKTCVRHELPNLINNIATSILEKVYTHSFKSFCTYIKVKFIDDYSTICDIPNCFSCNQTLN